MGGKNKNKKKNTSSKPLADPSPSFGCTPATSPLKHRLCNLRELGDPKEGVYTFSNKTGLSEVVSKHVGNLNFSMVFQQQDQKIQSPVNPKYGRGTLLVESEDRDAGPSITWYDKKTQELADMSKRISLVEKDNLELKKDNLELKEGMKRVIAMCSDSAAQHLRCFLKAVMNAVEAGFEGKETIASMVTHVRNKDEYWINEALKKTVVLEVPKDLKKTPVLNKSFRITLSILENLEEMRKVCSGLSTGSVHVMSSKKLLLGIDDRFLKKQEIVVGKRMFYEVFRVEPDVASQDLDSMIEYFITDLKPK